MNENGVNIQNASMTPNGTKNKLILKSSILSISLLSMGVTIISPALADIGKAFPDQSQSSIMMLVTMPTVLVIVFTIISGKLSEFISKRILVMIGTILFAAGGMFPYFSDNFTFLLAMRVVLGIGIGFFNPFISGLITDFFDGHEKVSMLGLQGATINVSSIVTSFIAGIVSVIDWHYTFLVHGTGILVFFIVLFFLPEPQRHPKPVEEKKVSVDKRVYLYSIGMLCYVALMFSIYTNLSFFIESNKLGNAATTGTAITFLTIGALVISLLFKKMQNLFKGYCVPLSVILTAIGLFIISLSHSNEPVFVGCVFIGVGFGLMNPAVVNKISEISHRAVTTFAISLLFSSFNVGSFISPYLVTLIHAVSGNNSSRNVFFICSIGLFAAALISLLAVINSCRKEKAAAAPSV